MRFIDADKIIFREIDEIGGEYEPYLGCSKSQIDSLPSITPQESVKKLEEQIKQLQNRCHALTHGQICVFCPYECEHKAESEGK